ncbi:S8 family peptidase [Hymenobacter coalescens]
MADDVPPLPRQNLFPFDPDTLDKSVITLPLLVKIAADANAQRWFGLLREFAERRALPWRRLLADLSDAWHEYGLVDRSGRYSAWVLRLWADLQEAGLAPPATAQAEWFDWLQGLLKSPRPAYEPELFAVIIDLNLQYPAGREAAKHWVWEELNALIKDHPQSAEHRAQGLRAVADPKNRYVQQYLFAQLEGPVIRRLVERDLQHAQELAAAAEAAEQTERARRGEKPTERRVPVKRALYRIWPDFPVNGLVNKSISTVKADAAQVSYAATGAGLVWAVLDSGIDEQHPHFRQHENLVLEPPLQHVDFSGSAGSGGPLTDEFGHGTHVAGIIAGELRGDAAAPIRAYSRQRDGLGDLDFAPVDIARISGIAPKCKLLSLKVMDEKGRGSASNLIAAIALIQELNGHGRNLIVQGVNMSVGYTFEPEWFACGQSPLCVEVNRLVRSGVVVVVAAGNTGYGLTQSKFNGPVPAGMSLTINDPGNADLAITVGSTHRDMPHVYGVSYFSSKGPTGDGRQKPDLVAPGEKIISCAAGLKLQEMVNKQKPCEYLEQSGTSMAAPHVSGAIAAFLSIRREFIGYPEKVKELFISSATDLKRERYFQGAGLVDLMRAIQSI